MCLGCRIHCLRVQSWRLTAQSRSYSLWSAKAELVLDLHLQSALPLYSGSMRDFRPTVSPLIITLLVLGLAGLSTAQTPSVTSQAPTQTSSSAPAATTSCGFVGDNNTYGLGIRLGIYIQWITSAIAYNFVPEEAVTMRSVNNFFTLSNFISTSHSIVYCSFPHGRTKVFCMLPLLEAVNSPVVHCTPLKHGFSSLSALVGLPQDEQEIMTETLILLALLHTKPVSSEESFSS